MPPGGHAEDGGKGELGCRRDRVRPNLHTIYTMAKYTIFFLEA
jgi:hypothetical protein